MAWRGMADAETLLRLRHRPTYLLRGHRGISVHSFEHGLLGLSVCAGGILGDLGGVDAGLGSVILRLGEWIVSERRVIGRPHVMLLWRLLLLCVGRVWLLRRDELVVGRRRGGPALAGRPFRRMACFFSRNDVDEEVKHVGFGQGRSDIGALKGPSLVLFGMDPRAHG